MDCLYCSVGNHCLCARSVMCRYGDCRQPCACLRREHRRKREQFCSLAPHFAGARTNYAAVARQQGTRART